MHEAKTGHIGHPLNGVPNIVNADTAMKRAARKGREICRTTGKAIAVIEDRLIRKTNSADANPID